MGFVLLILLNVFVFVQYILSNVACGFGLSTLNRLFDLPQEKIDTNKVIRVVIRRTDNTRASRKRTNNDLQNITQKPKDRTARTKHWRCALEG